MPLRPTGRRASSAAASACAFLAALAGADDRDDPVRREPRLLYRRRSSSRPDEPRALLGAGRTSTASGSSALITGSRCRHGRSEQRWVVGQASAPAAAATPASCSRPSCSASIRRSPWKAAKPPRSPSVLNRTREARAVLPLRERLALGVLDDQRDQIRDDPVRAAKGELNVETALALERRRAPRRAGARTRLQPSGVGDAVVGRAALGTQCVVCDP